MSTANWNVEFAFATPNAAEALEVVVQKVAMEMAIKTEKVLVIVNLSTSVKYNMSFEATEADTPGLFRHPSSGDCGGF
jgi:hypothetical protein